MQHNKLFRDRDETVNFIISNSRKISENEFKTKHEWVGIVIHRELCKRLKFEHATKRYMHDEESVQGNETD